MDLNFRYRGAKAADFRSIPGIAGVSAGLLKRYHLMVQPFFFCASNHSIEPGAYTVLVGCGLSRCSAACAFRRVQLIYTFALHRLD
jgi:hypothetical protein